MLTREIAWPAARSKCVVAHNLGGCVPRLVAARSRWHGRRFAARRGIVQADISPVAQNRGTWVGREHGDDGGMISRVPIWCIVVGQHR